MKEQTLVRLFAITVWTASLTAAASSAMADIDSLAMPENSSEVVDFTDPLTTTILPVGPFKDGSLATKSVEGSVRQQVWRVEQPVRSTLDLIAPLRDQLTAQGFTTVFACESAECGGFDFRYAAPVLPEPEMHVDLGDYRYLIAERGSETVTMFVSRSATAGFVQLIAAMDSRNADKPVEAPKVRLPQTDVAGHSVATTQDKGDLGQRNIESMLAEGGSVILEGLDFSSGAAELSLRDYPALDALAGWLKENPKLKIAVVGHTDASGGLDINIAISKKRAQSVRQYLLTRHSIPANQVEAEGAGYLAPIASNLTEAGRTKNRRVEVMVTSTQVQP